MFRKIKQIRIEKILQRIKFNLGNIIILVKLKLANVSIVTALLLATLGVGVVHASKEKIIVAPSVVVSVTIGSAQMTLWGYGAPESSLELTGIGVEQTTTSDANGYYSFDLVYLPASNTFPELCVIEIDPARRATPPTCVPPIPHGNYFYSIGPVILPPTISVGASQVRPGSQISAQGKTLPNSTVEVKLGRPDAKKGILGWQLVDRILAYYIPSFTVPSDDTGNFSFNMPTGESVAWRVFAIADYQGSAKSPKSNTLKFETVSAVSYFWQGFWAFLATFLVWPRIIILELLIIILLVIIVLIIVRRNRKKSKRVAPKENDQNYTKLVERYQEFIKGRKLS